MDCARVEFSQNNHSLKVNKIVSSTAHFFTYPSSMGGFAGEGGSPQSPRLAPSTALPGLQGKGLCECNKAATRRPQSPISRGRKNPLD